MNWCNQTRLAALRGQLIARLRRWYLPYAAVFEADLAGLARSWVLRAWFSLTMVVALIALVEPSGPQVAQKPAVAVLTAYFHADSATPGPQTIRQLLKIYIVVWVSFVIVLTGGTISSELGVVADAVLSRGISRWQYYLGKWSARLTAVLAVYTIVMLPTAIILRINHPAPPDSQIATVQAALIDTAIDTGNPPASMPIQSTRSWTGTFIALGQVAALLAFVATCGVAISASFDSTVISIAVGWVSIYGTGLILSLLDITPLSPSRLIRELPDMLLGHYELLDQIHLFSLWAAATLGVTMLAGSYFSARDV